MTVMREVAINGRWPLLLPEHRAARPEWPYWEKERLASMHENLGGGHHVVYDIGSEEGDFPALWASWGNDVVLVEPNPRVWPNIKLIWEANRLLTPPLGWFVGFAAPDNFSPDEEDWPHGMIGAPERWTCSRCNETFPEDEMQQVQPDGHYACPLCTDEDPPLTHAGGGWPLCAYGDVIGDHGFSNLCERPDIPRVRVDVLSELYGHPTAITIDVEGAELAVLQGAAGVLDNHRPLVWVSIHPEFSVDMYGVTKQDCLAFMADHGYDCELLAVDHEEHFFCQPRRGSSEMSDK